jgi:hypothetical protein
LYNKETYYDTSASRRRLEYLAKEFKRTEDDFARTKNILDRQKLEEVARELIVRNQECAKFYESNIGNEIEAIVEGLNCRETIKVAKSILAKYTK